MGKKEEDKVLKKKKKKKDFWGKLGDFVKDAVDCCLE